MKRLIAPFALALTLVVAGAFTLNNDPKSLDIGAKAPMTDYQMADVYGKTHSLASLAGESGLVVIFSCNTCPFVVGRSGKSEGWEGRYNDLYTSAQEYNFGAVLVNSNEAKRDNEDSKEAMMKQIKEKKYQMPYVIDENHKLADAFGARTTPHVYIFDKSMNLVYKGAIDDNVDSAKDVKANYVLNVFQSLTTGKPIDPNSTKPIGCSIKRVS